MANTRTLLFVPGRKDARLRLVEHIPVNCDIRRTAKAEYFQMLYWDKGECSGRTIRADRIIKQEVNEYGIIS